MYIKYIKPDTTPHVKYFYCHQYMHQYRLSIQDERDFTHSVKYSYNVIQLTLYRN